jgi:hypothetical protein
MHKKCAFDAGVGRNADLKGPIKLNKLWQFGWLREQRIRTNTKQENASFTLLHIFTYFFIKIFTIFFEKFLACLLCEHSKQLLYIVSLSHSPSIRLFSHAKLNLQKNFSVCIWRIFYKWKRKFHTKRINFEQRKTIFCRVQICWLKGSCFTTQTLSLSFTHSFLMVSDRKVSTKNYCFSSKYSHESN